MKFLFLAILFITAKTFALPMEPIAKEFADVLKVQVSLSEGSSWQSGCLNAATSNLPSDIRKLSPGAFYRRVFTIRALSVKTEDEAVGSFSVDLVFFTDAKCEHFESSYELFDQPGSFEMEHRSVNWFTSSTSVQCGEVSNYQEEMYFRDDGKIGIWPVQPPGRYIRLFEKMEQPYPQSQKRQCLKVNRSLSKCSYDGFQDERLDCLSLQAGELTRDECWRLAMDNVVGAIPRDGGLMPTNSLGTQLMIDSICKDAGSKLGDK